MKMKSVILIVILFSVFLIGCTSSQTGYSSYNQPQQQQYVGGGCGVAPSGDYGDTPIKALNSIDSKF